jgi:hypothetical protein
MSVLSIDTKKLPGKLSVALIDPAKVNLVANLGVSIGNFLGRDIPSHILAQDLIKLLELLAEAEVPGPGASVGEQDDGVGKSENRGAPPVQGTHLGPDDG